MLNTRLVKATLYTVILALTLQTLYAADLAVPETDEGVAGEGIILRDGWFQKHWKTMRTQWAKTVEADQNAVVFVGDSITHGWKDATKSFPGMKIARRGISGDTTRGVLYRLKVDVLSLNPSAVVLMIGTNDLGRNTKPDVAANNMKLIIADLKKHNPEMPIILCKIFPSSTSKQRSSGAIKRTNKLYFDAVKGDPQVTVVDTWALYANETGDAKKDEFPDLLHPNAKGYKKWGDALRPIFATLGLQDTEPDTFELEDGYTSLFNGKDLTGWGFRDQKTQKITDTFDGKTESGDKRYLAINDRLVVTTPPEGRRIQQLWTSKEFPEDFILKLEFRATPNADSGIFIRKPQLQCRDYVVAGPWKDLPNYKPQDWNEVIVTVKDGKATSTCNGDTLGKTMKLPPSGPIGLEGDRGQMEYRRIRIKTTD